MTIVLFKLWVKKKSKEVEWHFTLPMSQQHPRHCHTWHLINHKVLILLLLFLLLFPFNDSLKAHMVKFTERSTILNEVALVPNSDLSDFIFFSMPQ